MTTHEPRRGYNGTEDLVALSNFVTATGISDVDLAWEVYLRMLHLNQAIRNADVVGLTVRLVRAEHIHMNSPVLMLSITRDGKDVPFA